MRQRHALICAPALPCAGRRLARWPLRWAAAPATLLPARLNLLPLLSLLLLFWLSIPAVQAASATPAATDPVLEKRVLILSEQLRCLVCQNQTIADSHADLAIDLRNQVREKMQAGWSDEKILDFMVQRYGDFVLYKPPVKGNTMLLWFGPFILFVVALLLLFGKLKRQSAQSEPDAGQLQRAASLLAGGDGAQNRPQNGPKSETQNGTEPADVPKPPSSGSNKESV